MEATGAGSTEGAPSRERRPPSTAWAGVGGMAAFILLLNAVGWGVLVLVVAPAHYEIGASGVLGVGLGITAFTLGMRHAFDADHIAAIDNTTRKLLADGQRPVSVGFWFSLGHSTVVFVLCALLAVGIRALAGQVEDDGSALQTTLGMVGTLVSGTFLIIIGLINLVVLKGIFRIYSQMKEGSYSEDQLERQLNNRGAMNRVLGPLTRTVAKPWHMYPVGILFGLGFDTATEISLLVLAGGASAFALPWYAILVLPILFAAGMSLLDTVDGVFMNHAYGWAFAHPVRKIFYNITTTTLSVVVALVIGTIELAGLVAEKAGIQSGPLAWLGALGMDAVGFIMVGLFAATWTIAICVYKFGRIDQRWAAVPQPTDRPSDRATAPAVAADPTAAR